MKLINDNNNKNKLIYINILLAISIFISLSNYIRIPLSGISDFIKYAIHFAILSTAVTGLLLFISTHRWLFAVTSPLILLISLTSAASLYFYNITITSEIIEVVLKTDWSVSKEFISIRLLITLLILFLFILALTIFRFKLDMKSRESFIFLIIGLTMMAPAYVLNKKRNNTIISRAPFSIISATREYQKAIAMSKSPREAIGNDAIYTGDDSLLVVLVLGESLRNDHLSFNGYNRNTTPLLSKDSIYAFSTNKSLYTYTAASIPQILTRADEKHPERAYKEKSIISIYQHCNFETTWLANQVPDYTYSAIAKNCDTYLNLNLKTSTYSDIISTDQNILDQIDNSLNTTYNKARFLILHTIGSHWYYNYRCPEKMRHFFPITSSRSFANNSSEQMINSYDNSVLFTDYFIDKVIKKIEHEEAILIFTSDHGESLGENGKWLHAFEQESLHNAACFIWMSDKYKKKHPLALAIKGNINKPSSTSAIFHTLLHASDIETTLTDTCQSLISKKFQGYK